MIAKAINHGLAVHTVAVTGTNGKTSISTLVHNMLRNLDESSAFIEGRWFWKK